MSLTIRWLPLSPGEKPGDPELGGWRPFRSSGLNRKRENFITEAVSLTSSIRWLADAITRRNVRFALNYVAHKLAQNQI